MKDKAILKKPTPAGPAAFAHMSDDTVAEETENAFGAYLGIYQMIGLPLMFGGMFASFWLTFTISGALLGTMGPMLTVLLCVLPFTSGMLCGVFGKQIFPVVKNRYKRWEELRDEDMRRYRLRCARAAQQEAERKAKCERLARLTVPQTNLDEIEMELARIVDPAQLRREAAAQVRTAYAERENISQLVRDLGVCQVGAKKALG